MAKERASIVIHGLDDAHVDLTPISDRRTPVEVPSDPEDVPAGKRYGFPPLGTEVTFVKRPLGVDTSGETILGGFASLRPGAKRERMVPYPIRLPTSQIAELESLREERGIIPAEFIRDAVASCLALLLRS